MYIDDSSAHPDRTYSSEKIERLLDAKVNLSDAVLYENWTPGEKVELIEEVPPLVTASPEGRNFSQPFTVTLTANEPATIYYTLDGSTPTESSPVYSSPIPITGTVTLKYFAIDVAGNASAVQIQVYSSITSDTKPPTVTSSPPGNKSFNSAQTVTLTADEAASIYYTLNGSDPTTSSSVYTGPIPIRTTTNLKYFAVDRAGNKSPIYSFWFTIDQDPPNDVTSLAYTKLTATSVRLTWNVSGSTDVTFYEVFSGQTVVARTRNRLATYSDIIGLTPSTTYTFTVRAKDLANNYSFGQSITLTTPPVSPSLAGLVTNGLVLLEETPENYSFLYPRNYFDGNEPFTLTMTVKSDQGTSFLNIFDSARENEATTSVTVKRNYSPNTQFVVTLFARDLNTNAIVATSLFTASLSTAPYYHVVLVRDASAISLYLDNALIMQKPFGPQFHIARLERPLLQVGDKVNNVWYEYLAYYNRALTTEERAQNYKTLL
ncbi:chitobiase/beta-hexosaminidase C-terminal domain-containing protein [Paenibacillus antri]|nr:chitobiase/beta-hexosaminidase C-terminal domain-containing protein [Paenibacillus antri]